MHDGEDFTIYSRSGTRLDGPNGSISESWLWASRSPWRNLQAVIEELGQEVSLDTMRRRFCPRNEIVEMKLEVNLSVYDELLGPDRIHSTGQEVA